MLIGLAVAALLLFGCAGQLPQGIGQTLQGTGQFRQVFGTALQTQSYCGGAAPPQEIIDGLATPKPLANKTLYLKNGSTNSQGPYLAFTTDSQGRFALSLPAGTYCVVEDYKRDAPDAEAYKKSMGAPGSCATVNPSCLAVLWQECDASFTVGSADTNLTVQSNRRCPWSTRCIEWGCPLPP